MSIDVDEFRSVLGRFASGVTILTAKDPEGLDHGMTVSAFSSVSLDPPLVLACIDRTADMHAVLRTASHFGISILSDGQEALSRRFAELPSNRFDGIGYTRGDSGVVLLDDALAHLECRCVKHFDAGDHTIYVGEVERSEAMKGMPLLYFRGGYTELES
jgi:flavin reductase (DIM6/NTAB) family NADH-FMN oxidoreductase RutF